MGPLAGVDRSLPVVYVQAFPNGEGAAPIRLNVADRILSLKFIDNELHEFFQIEFRFRQA